MADNVPGSSRELVKQIRVAGRKLKVKKRLAAFQTALDIVGQEDLRGYKYFLLELRPDEEYLEIKAFRKGELGKATVAYLAAERELVDTTGDAVLVASDSLESLRRAFPNYFGDTRRFVQEMDNLLS